MIRSTCAYRRVGADPIQATSVVDQLTDREKEVFLLLGTGLGNRRLATELHISERTVKAHISRIVDKLGHETRLQSAVLAVLVHDTLCVDTDCAC